METLRAFIEEHLQIWEVPGCAVGAVKGGEVVLNEGFGLRDVGAGLPVTPKTLFAIGSTTKAFTAAAVGAMVDDGLIEWDKPVRDYIPGFRLHDPVATERITPLDLLSHRTGLPRHEFAWMAHPERTRAELVSRLKFLPPSKDIRETFQYCNLGYVTAGHLVEVVTGMTWEEYVTTRLLKPLGMDDTNFRVSDLIRADDYSKAHERRNGPVIEIPYRVIDETGPAGSINSSITNMLNWVRVNLDGGRIGDVDVVTSSTIRKMQSPQMVLGGGAARIFPEVSMFAYGLGWMIGEYRGHRLVEHGGGIDGFLTELMLLPDDGAGLVVLTNSTSSSLGRVIAYRLLDEFLGLEPLPWHDRIKSRRDAALGGMKEARAASPRIETPVPRKLEEYIGDYSHPGYGTFTIDLEDGKLVPRFGTLKIDLVHRHFDVFDLEWRELTDDVTIFPLIFQTAPEGDVIALTIPFEPLLDPIRFERQPETVDPETLKSLTGTYVMGPIEIVVALKGEDTLTVAEPGSPPGDLVPEKGLRFSVKGGGRQTIEFVLASDGAVEKVIIQPAGVFTPKKDS